MSDNTAIFRLFAQRVRALRKKQGSSQEELADRIGMTLDTISNIERGATSTKLKTAAALADALGVSLADLFQPEPKPAASADERKRAEAVAELSELLDQLEIEQIRAVTLLARGVLNLSAKG